MAFLVCQLDDIWNELQSEMEGTHGRDFFLHDLKWMTHLQSVPLRKEDICL